jgi:hypothetical protein
MADDPKHWRMLAVEVRAQAGQMVDPKAKRKMLDVADGYDKLAKEAEERLTLERKREGNG